MKWHLKLNYVLVYRNVDWLNALGLPKFSCVAKMTLEKLWLCNICLLLFIHLQSGLPRIRGISMTCHSQCCPSDFVSSYINCSYIKQFWIKNTQGTYYGTGRSMTAGDRHSTRGICVVLGYSHFQSGKQYLFFFLHLPNPRFQGRNFLILWMSGKAINKCLWQVDREVATGCQSRRNKKNTLRFQEKQKFFKVCFKEQHLF